MAEVPCVVLRELVKTQILAKRSGQPNALAVGALYVDMSLTCTL